MEAKVKIYCRSFDLRLYSLSKALLKREDSDLEPYYPFFRWMPGNYKILYLTAKRHSDGISTILFSPQGREICYHSWFARFYSMPFWAVRFAQKDKGRQKLRIDVLIKEAYIRAKLKSPTPSGARTLATYGAVMNGKRTFSTFIRAL